MTRKGDVKLKVWWSSGRTELERTVEVDLVENAAGRVFINYDDEGYPSVMVEVTDLGAAQPLLEDTRLVLRPDHTGPKLWGKVTPRGWKIPLEGALFVGNRPLLQELYDGAIALEAGLDKACQVIWNEVREQDATSAEE